MSRTARLALTLACVVFAAFLLAVAARLLPLPTEAAERGVTAQLIVAWLLIATAEVAALVLAALLVRRSA